MFDYFRIVILPCALWWKMLSIACSFGGPHAKFRGAHPLTPSRRARRGETVLLLGANPAPQFSLPQGMCGRVYLCLPQCVTNVVRGKLQMHVNLL